MSDAKRSAYCELINNIPINDEIFQLDFMWYGTVPQAGQFFMIKPKRSAIFLGRPISVAKMESNTVTFLIARRGKGTLELSAMRAGEEAELTGPLGNAWTDFLSQIEKKDNAPDGAPIALIGGGIGLAPLQALLCEESEYNFDVYAGFRSKSALFKPDVRKLKNVLVATEDAPPNGCGTEGLQGRIPDFLEPARYAAVCACGPEPMLKVVAAKCKAANVPCFVSMERRMACGVGACLGCTVRTINGNRRCCADGPIFKADEVIFDE